MISLADHDMYQFYYIPIQSYYLASASTKITPSGTETALSLEYLAKFAEQFNEYQVFTLTLPIAEI